MRCVFNIIFNGDWPIYGCFLFISYILKAWSVISYIQLQLWIPYIHSKIACFVFFPPFSPLSIFALLWWSLNLLQVWDESKGATRKDKQSTEITGISQLRKYLRCVWDCNTKETNNTTLTYFQSSVWFHIESYFNILSIVSVSHFTLISLGVDFSILLISWPNVH